jgi:hypothetical protein
MRRSVRASWLLVVVIGLAGVASMSLAGSAGASDKGWCKDGGWTGFRDDTGGVFKNQGQCVSYVAQGWKTVRSDRADGERPVPTPYRRFPGRVLRDAYDPH